MAAGGTSYLRNMRNNLCVAINTGTRAFVGEVVTSRVSNLFKHKVGTP